MTERQYKRAGKIYALAQAVHHNDVGINLEENEVCEMSTRFALSELQKMGIDPADVRSLEECITVAKSYP